MRRHSRSDYNGDQVFEGDLEQNEKHNNEQRRLSKSDRRSNIVKEYLRDYTSNSNLHGLKYIGEEERTFVEKIFWLFMCICCVVLCAGLIRKVWIKWQESPVIVSFSENPTPVWQVPYPAVTVCFETKAIQSKFDFTEYYHLYHVNETRFNNMTDDECNLFEDISLVCNSKLITFGRMYSSGLDTVTNIKKVAPNLTDVFFACKWKDIPSEDCSELFSPILTEEGLCYTFNMLGPDELFRVENLHTDYPYLETNKTSQGWSLDEGYGPKIPMETYPHRGTGYGVKSGLTLLLKANKTDLDYMCTPVQGFKVLLHNPAELPRLSQQFFRLPLSQDVVVAVKPKMMTTSEGLRPYHPYSRQCYFPTERYLRYFKVYTQANCEMECLSNFTYLRCGCVHFGMPRSSDMAVCNAGSVACLDKSQMELVAIAIQSGMGEDENLSDSLDEARNISSRCKCLTVCTSIEYEAETSQADYDWRAVFRSHKINITDDMKDLICARMMIFFKDPQFITSRRSELYGQTDFLANCGGLLGLFMGFSILSVAEIIYFLTLRIYCVYWKKRNNKNQLKKIYDKENIASPNQTKEKEAYKD